MSTKMTILGRVALLGKAVALWGVVFAAFLSLRIVYPGIASSLPPLARRQLHPKWSRGAYVDLAWAAHYFRPIVG